MDTADLKNRFTYHAPKPGQPEIYQGLRDGALLFALHITDMVPDCDERKRAIDRLEEVVMLANAGIARHG